MADRLEGTQHSVSEQERKRIKVGSSSMGN
jgi:hypothetical protein